MGHLFAMDQERIAARLAMFDYFSLLAGVLLTAAVGVLLGLADPWVFVATFIVGSTAAVLLGYIFGFYLGRSAQSRLGSLLRIGGVVALVAAASRLAGATLPPLGSPGWLLPLTLAFSGLVAVFAQWPATRLRPAADPAPRPDDGLDQPAPAGQRRRVLLLGCGSLRDADADGALDIISARADVCAVVDLGPARGPDGDLASAPEQAKEILKAAASSRADQVVVDERQLSPLLIQTVLLLRYAGVEVVNVQTLVQRLTGTIPSEGVSALSVLAAFEGVSRAGLVLKRGIDLALATAGLVCLAPAMLAVALAIRLEDGGPVLYRQTRVGRGMAPFVILKFRSMRADAEPDGKARWAERGDRRVTAVGRLIRRTRLDETPQLLNVLRGDMSLVGPRPERPEFVSSLTDLIPGYQLRHLVRPGLTGWAQVNYPYGASVEDARRKLGYDLYYVQQVGILFDLVILARTLRVVLIGEGAR